MYISYIYIYKVLRSCDTDLCLLPMACGQKLHDLPAKTMKTTAAFLKSRRILSENRRVFGICFFHRHLLRSFRHVLCVWCTSSLRSPTLYDDVVEMIFASLALCEGNLRVTASGTCCVCVWCIPSSTLHVMKQISTSLALFGVNPPVIGGFSSQRDSCAYGWWFLWCDPEQSVQRLPVI